MSQHIWSKKDTFELIKHYKANTSLWDSRDLRYKNKMLKKKTINNIASAMNASPAEVVKKLRNLRCQLCQEIKKTNTKIGFEGKKPSSWCYFAAMKFLIPVINKKYEIGKQVKEGDSEEMYAEEYKDLEKTEETRPEKIFVKCLNNAYNEEPKHTLRFLPKVSDKERNTMEYMEFDRMKEKYEKIPTKYVNINYNEEPRHSLQIVPKVPDDDDRFGEYVALELRSLRSEANKRKLKSEIRRAICRIVEFDDANVVIPSVPLDPSLQHSPSSPKYSQICEISNVKSEVTQGE